MHLNEKQISKLDKYINEINNDQTLKHKIEKINLLLTNSNQMNGSMSFLNDSLNFLNLFILLATCVRSSQSQNSRKRKAFTGAVKYCQHKNIQKYPV